MVMQEHNAEHSVTCCLIRANCQNYYGRKLNFMLWKNIAFVITMIEHKKEALV